MIYSNNWLLAELEDGAPMKYLFFWGHRAAKDAAITASCFSQWWPCEFTHDGISYRSAEHWMMASKARLFGDSEIEQRIIAATSPAAAKKLGRKVRGFDPEIWDDRKSEIVVEGNLLKFGQDERLKNFLLQTAPRVIVEASPVDAIWGIGLAADDPRAQHPAEWPGENLLGYALMEVRRQLAGADI